MRLNAFDCYELKQGNYSCEIIGNYGAALNAYKLNGFNFIDGYLHPDDVVGQQYKGVVLAPFPNRTKDATFLFEGKQFSLTMNRLKEGLALHGFLYNKAFEVTMQSINTLHLSYNYKGNEPGFPFPFSLTVKYLLDLNGNLTVTSKVKNTGPINMPFGFGWHPYFKLDERVDNLRLDLPATNQLVLSSKLIPTGAEKVFNTKTKELSLANVLLDDCFRLTENGANSFTLKSKKYTLSVSTGINSNFPYFQIYTPPNRQSIAIEPMSCAPNALNNLNGLTLLKPEEEKEFIYQLLALSESLF